MNCCRETTKMGVPPGNRPAGLARKDEHIIRARCAPLSPASGFPVSWSQQLIHEISWLGDRAIGSKLLAKGMA
jgi:hypothetical protein